MKKSILLLLIALVGLGFTAQSQKTWTGNADQVWDWPPNWLPLGTPGATDDVVIPDVSGASGNFPVIGAGTAAVCNNMTIESGASLTILEIPGPPPDGSLDTDGDLTIEDGASMLGSINPTVTGTVNVELQITGGADVWHLFSSPVQSIQVGDLFTDHDNTYVHQWTETSTQWVAIETIGFGLTPGIGFSANLQGGTETVSFTGDLNNFADMTKTISHTEGGAYPTLQGFNLLGNPFPSALDLGDASWTWPAQMVEQVDIWDPTAGDYITWTAGASDFTNIPAMQAFFVRVSDGNQNIDFTIPNDARVHSTDDFYKSGISNFLNLYVDAGQPVEFSGNMSRAAIGFSNAATEDFDNGIDAYNLFGAAETPEVYTKINDEALKFNNLPSRDGETVIVNLYFDVSVAGEYTLFADGINNFDNTEIILEDLMTGQMIDLNEDDAYTFNYTIGEAEHRFNVHFKSTTGINDFDNSGIEAYSYTNSIYVVNDNETKAEVEVFNVMGQKVLSKTINNGMSKFEMNEAGCYVVKVLNGNKTLSKKVVIK